MCADKQKKLLLVEDEPIIAMMQSRILTNNNYHVVIAYSGEQAVELFEDYNDINLILMDIDLGYGMDGTEAAKIILEKQDIPLVFLSSHTEQEIVSKTENITSYGYIVKNTEETVLLASINMAFKLFESRLKEKEKEKALELSENRYFSLFDNISSGVAIYKVVDDGNDFIFHDLNKASIEIEGFIKEEIIGKSVLTVRSDIIRFGLLDVFKRVWKTGKPEYFPLKVYKEQNLDKYFDNYVYKLPSGEIVAVYNDYTEQKTMEEKIQQSEDNFFDLFLNHAAVKLLIDPEDGSIYSANYAAERFYGWTREQLCQMNISDINIKQKNNVQGEMTKATDEQKNIFRFKHAIANGKIKDVVVLSNEIFIRGKHLLYSIVQDISNEIHAIMAVEGNIEFFNKLFDTISVAVYYKDINGRYVHVNNAYAKMMGYDKEQMIGKTLLELDNSKHSLFNLEKDLELFKNKGVQVYSTKYTSKSGITNDFVVHKASVLDSNNQICGIIGMIFKSKI